MAHPLLAAARDGVNGYDPFLPQGFIRVEETVRVADAARDVDVPKTSIVPSPNDVLALELDDGTTIFTSPSRFANAVRETTPDAISADGAVDLDAFQRRGATATRDLFGGARRFLSRITRLAIGGSDDLTSGILKELGIDAATLAVSREATRRLMRAIEGQLKTRPGLYRWRDLEDAAANPLRESDFPVSAQPILVFIHGTASSSLGSFSALEKESRDYWSALDSHYGGRVYALEHRTMSESPIENALQLAIALPAGARLHLVTHSRGGIVGDLLALDTTAYSDPDLLAIYTPAGDGDDVSGQGADAYAEQRETLKELGAVLRAKNIVVERYVRVAAPARGTRLASSNIDVFLSVLLHLIGTVPFLAGQPLYSAFKRIVLEVAKNRTRANVIPGIEAMIPESPMARFLGSAAPNAATELAVIAGDIESSGLLKRLGLLFTDHVFFTGGDNDLVVDTDSMYAGIARPASTRVLFDRGKDVSHFRYFRNTETRQALSAWLRELPAAADLFAAFSASRPLTVAEQQRAAVIARDGTPANMPIVVVIPGIMGSHLWDGGAKDRIWMDVPDLLLGGFHKLQWDRNKGVAAEALLDSAYGALCRYLAASHQVETHPYDWRQPLDVLADQLAARVRPLLATTTANRPIRLLAHSMGGLVVRALAYRHPDVFDALMTRTGARFVMLGTPNHGAHTMVEMLIGKGDTVRKLAMFSRKTSLQDVLNIIGDFRGALQLLPSGALPDAEGAFGSYFEPKTWDTFRAEVRDFWFGNGRTAMPPRAALDAGRWLWDQYAADTRRLVRFADRISYVFGVAPTTTWGVVKRGNDWKLLGSPQGDGTVPWASGRIEGIGSYYYMPAKHGDLADTPEYFSSIQSLLTTGAPDRLLAQPPQSRDVAPATTTTYDAGPPVFPSVTELELDVVGQRSRVDRVRKTGPVLRVKVRAGDLRDSSRPLLLGHYAQDAIAGPENTLDREVLKGALSARHNLGLYAGPVGTATIVLSSRDSGGVPVDERRGAIVTGLGYYDGTLSVKTLTDAVRTGVLRYLLHLTDVDPMATGAATRDVKLATLLVGYNSSATLSIDDSIGAILTGVIEANKRIEESFKASIRVADLEIVELYLDTAISVGRSLRTVARRLNAQADAYQTIDAAPEIMTTESMRYRLEDSRTMSYWPRLHATDGDRDDDGAPEYQPPAASADCGEDLYAAHRPEPPRDPRRLVPAIDPNAPLWKRRQQAPASKLKWLYVGQRARAEKVMSQRQPGLVDQLVARQLQRREYDRDFGRTLFQLLVPNEFKDVARQLQRVVLVVDQYTANIPWELMLADESKPLALCTRVVRQLGSSRFRARVSQAPGRAAFVLGNPSTSGFSQAYFPNDPTAVELPSLPGAEREAEVVHAVLASAGLEVTQTIGHQEEALTIVNRLYRQPYRVVHIAAHGVHELLHVDGRRRTGVVLSDGMLLTAAEIGAMESVPELVFINCCHLGQMSQLSTAYNRLAYSLARELIDMGVRAVVAAGWAVDDGEAERFAREFYMGVFKNDLPFGDAVFNAREVVYAQNPSSATWAAYQAYGDPMWRANPRRDGAGSRGGSDAGFPGSGDAGSRGGGSRSGSGEPGAPSNFVAPEEIVAELDKMRAEVRRLDNVPVPSELELRARRARQLRDVINPEWMDRLDVRAAFGLLFADLGSEYFEEAIGHYRAAVHQYDVPGNAPISAIEQLANLEARLGELRGDTTIIERAIERLKLLQLATAMPTPTPEPASAPNDIERPVWPNTERMGLLGSAYKRLAAVHAKLALTGSGPHADHIAAMWKALQASLEAYGGRVEDTAAERIRFMHRRGDMRSAMNRVLLSTLAAHHDSGMARSIAEEQPQRARELIETAELAQAQCGIQSTLDSSYWRTIVAGDVKLARFLVHQEFVARDPERALADVLEDYLQARKSTLVAPKAYESTVHQLRLLALFYGACALDQPRGGANANRFRAAAKALRILVDKLIPGLGATIPIDEPDREPAAAPRKRSRPRSPKKAGKSTRRS